MNDQQCEETVDEKLQKVDLESLRRFAAAGEDASELSAFDNRFFNSFVNSPNFTKRLRHPERRRPDV